jgi:predicted Zn-dependent peptidase
LKKKDAEKRTARMLAYNRLFSGQLLGNTIIDIDTLRKINLSQVRSFYRKTYKPQNSFLFIKGNVNPHITFGLVEKALKSFKKSKNIIFYTEKLTINRARKIYILDVENIDSPTVYWFHAVPPLRDKNHLPFIILNNILFGYPIGNVFKNAGFYGIRNIKKMESEILNHAETSVICNTVKLNYGNVEKFILLYEQEVRKLRLRKINRSEYLNTLNYFLGKAKVDTRRFENDIHFEIHKSIYSVDRKTFEVSPTIFQKVTLNRLNHFLSNTEMFKFHRDRMTAEVIVVVGNPKLLLRNFRVLKPEIIRYIH